MFSGESKARTVSCLQSTTHSCFPRARSQANLAGTCPTVSWSCSSIFFPRLFDSFVCHQEFDGSSTD